MKLFKSISILLFLPIFLFCQDSINLSWNQPEISSNTFQQFLERRIDEKTFVTRLDSIRKESFKFALFPILNFKETFYNYFSNEDKNVSFLEYNSKNKDIFSNINLNVFAGSDYFSSLSDEYYFLLYKGLKLTANIENKLLFYGYWWGGYFLGDEDYAKEKSQLIDGWTKHTDKLYLDNLTAKIAFLSKYGTLSIGRGKYQIGNNIGGSIILNDACNDYGFFSYNIDFGKLSLSFIHTNLIPDSTSSEAGDNSLSYNHFEDKYLVVHIIDWNPNSKVHFFFGEEIIYGSRSIELSYLLPHTFLRITEHNLHDRDNVLIFSGFNFKPSKQNTLYFNFIIDELSKGDLWENINWWGNKYALQMGNSYKTLNSKHRFTFEFTAIRPWVYTHNILPNKFSNDGIGLGFPAGSNLIQFTSEINLSLLENTFFDLHGSFTRQGSVGSSFVMNYDDRPSDEAKWLAGEIINFYDGKAVITWLPFQHHKIKFGIKLHKTENTDLEKELSISYYTFY